MRSMGEILLFTAALFYEGQLAANIVEQKMDYRHEGMRRTNYIVRKSCSSCVSK